MMSIPFSRFELRQRFLKVFQFFRLWSAGAFCLKWPVWNESFPSPDTKLRRMGVFPKVQPLVSRTDIGVNS